MVSWIVIHLVIVVVLLVVGYFYGKTILAWMGTYAQAIGKQAIVEEKKGLAWLNAKLMGWKTHILVVIALVPQSLAFLAQTDWTWVKDLNFELIFRHDVANIITFAATALIPLTHALGLAKAAETPPQN